MPDPRNPHHPRRFGIPLTLALATLLAVACGQEPSPVRDATLMERYSVPTGVHALAQPPCEGRNPLGNAYFGDLHVHTSVSSDAYMFGVRVLPDDAYRYAFGEAIELPDETSARGRTVRIDRPLDFAAVTDHAEFLGEMGRCTDPDSEVYESDLCQSIQTGFGRSMRLGKMIMLPRPWREDEVCGADGGACRQAASEVWARNIEAAERWNRHCEQTTFIAYEYSSHRLGSNLHRNVVFANSAVPSLPVSYIEATREWDLWKLLKRGCIENQSGCDVLAIPHNSNISNGRMFNVEYEGTDGPEAEAARARLRMELEPVVEIMQHKGDSECRDGIEGVLGSEDELCRFEQFQDLTNEMRFGEVKHDPCAEGWWGAIRPHMGPDCLSRLSYTRYALIEGLSEEARIGVNPFKFGLLASTDTHNGLAGGADERSFPGHLGRGDDSVSDRMAFDSEIPGNVSNNPGGLAGVWAEENSRESIFAAIRRKEVFGTSGPRIRPRLYAGWDLPEDLCSAPDRLEVADANSVPMGGDLPDPAGTPASGPAFLAIALADAGTADAPGTPLQRLQIVKGWVDPEGERHQQVYEIAGNADNGADVDPNTCVQRGSGVAELCGVWRDPDFDPGRRAVYYLRAVENPSCRYNAWQCVGLEGVDRPAGCDDPRSPKVIQERAWTSPIWYTPS
jgi:hypothetical protein